MKKVIFFAAALLVSVSAAAQSLTLDRCLEMAKSANTDILSSRIEVEKAEAQKKQVFTKYFPQVSVGGVGYYALNPLIKFGINDIQSDDMRNLLQAVYDAFADDTDIQKDIELMKWGASATVLAAQPVYAGGRIRTGNKLAGLGVEAYQLQADQKERDVLEDVESSFYLVLGLQEKEGTVDAALELLDSLALIVDVSLKNGLITKTDALQVELKRNEMLSNKQKLTSGLRLAKRFLCEKIGQSYSDELVFEEPAEEMQLPLRYDYSEVGGSIRPEMRLLELNVEAERLKKKLTLGEALPQVAVIAGAAYGNIVKNDPTFNAVACLSLSIPITAWWETSHKLKQHDASIRQARLMQNNYSRMMSLEEEKAYSDMMDAWTLLSSDETALDLAKENFRLAQLNYDAGANTISEVLQAYTLLLQAQNAATDHRSSYRVARRRLLDLRGE